jgi:four helix bundle protein
MNSEDMKQRTKAFAVGAIRFCRTLPATVEGRVIAGQLIRSSSSIGANYRAACRARSRREFAAKIGIVLEEADESVFWCELAVESGVAKIEAISPLLNEAGELVSIMAASKLTLERKVASRKSSI